MANDNRAPAKSQSPFKVAPIVSWGYKYSSIVILAVCCLVAFGIYSLDVIDKNEFPNYTVTEGVFAASYPGATAEQIEQEVVKPMEDYVFSFKEVNKIKTTSDATSGQVIIYVQLDDNVKDTDQFWNKFRAGTAGLKLKLPPGVLGTEVISDFGATSAVLLTMSSDQKTYRELKSYMDGLQDRLRSIESVGKMTVYGQQMEQIAVYIDPEKLSNYGIGEKTIALALASQGFATTGGELRTPDYTAPIAVSRALNSVKEVSDQIVFTLPDGDVVTLGDVAHVVKEYPRPSSFVTNNGEKSLVLSIEIKDGKNVVEMGKEVEKHIAAFEQTLPDDITLFKITNQPYDVNNSVVNFLTELLIAIAGVLIAIIILLPFRVAMIAASTIPITIFISLGLFYVLGIELNTVTLACLIVSLGMIVDNSVVIIDEYVSLLGQGLDRKTATLRSATEFFKAIISATLAISITFFPFLVTMTGMMHDFLLDFPWAITIILFISLIVAEMLVPLLQYKIIDPARVLKSEGDTPAADSGKKRHVTFLMLLQQGYDKLIDLCFKWPKTVLAAGILSVIAGSYILFTRPIQLMPVAERNQFAVEINLPTGTPLARTSQVADSLATILKKDDRVVSVAIFHGCSSPRFQTTYTPQVGGPNYAQFIVNTQSSEATIEVLDEYTARYQDYFPDARVRFKQLSYETASDPIDVRVSGTDYNVLQNLADSITGIMRNIPGLHLVRNSLNAPQLTAKVIPDEDAMNRLGLNNTLLQLTLAMRYSDGIPVASVWEGDYEIPVVAKTKNATRGDISELTNERIPLLGPENVPLSQFAKVKPSWTYGQMSHRNGIPTVSIMAEISRGDNAIDLTKAVKSELKDFKLPDGYNIEYGGVWEQTFEILPNILTALAMAATIIFFILLMHYKKVGISLLLVGCLLCCLPGMAIGLLIQNMVLSLTCTLGLISLMGILVRNAIIMLDYAEHLQESEGMSIRDASLASAKRRMRPIFLTSSAASMGVVPMVISDSGLWQPMGTVIFWGTIITMVYILTFIPIAYWKTQPKGKNAVLEPAPAQTQIQNT
jgi:multidrug efflux pump subunit AcrB